MKILPVPGLLFLLLSISTSAQKLSKSDQLSLQHIQTHVMFLADDKLEGRRTGTKGEQLAYEYISTQFQKNGLEAKGTNGYLQPFEVNEGKEVLQSSFFFVDGEPLRLERDYFPFSWSKDGSGEAVVSPGLNEGGNPWFWDLKDVIADNANNPHFDVMNTIRSKEKDAVQKGATALFIYNSGKADPKLKYEPKDRSAVSGIPVVYLQNGIAEKLVKDPSHIMDVKFKVAQGDKIRKGHNVAGYINNNATSTIIIGAHYDHLGYGEDHNSRHTGSAAIHNGADDNASGTAALIELGRLLKKDGSKMYNYLLIAFSGEELGLYGSKHFTENPTIQLNTVNFMVNMDMVGRFNDSSKTVTIGGFGTSPSWSKLLYADKKPAFTIRVDSSGTGPSDHTSFYRKDIPVLFFFTGLHTDYHKPGDDYEKINYAGEVQIVKFITRLIERSSRENKLVFTKTREQQTSTTARFTVSMGIMPDYTYSGNGVKVDGVSEGKPAQKAGLKTGDVVIKLGDYNISSVESYMQTLGKFKKGDAAKVRVKRGSEEMELEIVF
jgi:hypothetical protein